MKKVLQSVGCNDISGSGFQHQRTTLRNSFIGQPGFELCARGKIKKDTLPTRGKMNYVSDNNNKRRRKRPRPSQMLKIQEPDDHEKKEGKRKKSKTLFLIRFPVNNATLFQEPVHWFSPFDHPHDLMLAPWYYTQDKRYMRAPSTRKKGPVIWLKFFFFGVVDCNWKPGQKNRRKQQGGYG